MQAIWDQIQTLVEHEFIYEYEGPVDFDGVLMQWFFVTDKRDNFWEVVCLDFETSKLKFFVADDDEPEMVVELKIAGPVV